MYLFLNYLGSRMSVSNFENSYTKKRANLAFSGIFQEMFSKDTSVKACILDGSLGNTTRTLKAYFGEKCDIVSPNMGQDICRTLEREFGNKSPNCAVSKVLAKSFDIYFLDYNHSWQGQQSKRDGCIPKNDIKQVLEKIKENNEPKFLAFSVTPRSYGYSSKDTREEIIKLVKRTKRDFSLIRLSYNRVHTYFVIFPSEEQTDLKGKMAALFIQKRGEKYTDFWNNSLPNQDTQGLLPMCGFDLDEKWAKRIISVKK